MDKTYHSRYRDWILNYFETHENKRISAGDIYRAQNAAGLGANKATVYRNLDRLCAEGRITFYRHRDSDEKYYQLCREDHSCESHLHVYCKDCGAVIHLDCAFMDEIRDHLQKDHGYLLDCNASSLVGLCPECQKKRKEMSNS